MQITDTSMSCMASVSYKLNVYVYQSYRGRACQAYHVVTGLGRHGTNHEMITLPLKQSGETRNSTKRKQIGVDFLQILIQSTRSLRVSDVIRPARWKPEPTAIRCVRGLQVSTTVSRLLLLFFWLVPYLLLSILLHILIYFCPKHETPCIRPKSALQILCKEPQIFSIIISRGGLAHSNKTVKLHQIPWPSFLS